MATTKEFGASPSGDNTIIGPSILISGKLTGDEDLTVRGRVEGELALSKTLIVEPSGIVKANVEVKNAIISGVVVGNITATESVELTKEGRMVGDIRSPRVIIVDGASFRGRVDMGEGDGRPLAERPATTRPVVRSTSPARPATPAARPAPRPVAPVARPATAAVPRPEVKADKGAPPKSDKPAPPPPPAPPTLAEAGKKKVLVKKKK